MLIFNFVVYHWLKVPALVHDCVHVYPKIYIIWLSSSKLARFVFHHKHDFKRNTEAINRSLNCQLHELAVQPRSDLRSLTPGHASPAMLTDLQNGNEVLAL